MSNYYFNTTYVFTNLIRVRNSKKISRTAGGGTWGGQTGPKKVVDSATGETIGYMRMLSFEHPNAGASSEFGHWIMHEYVLSDDVVKNIGIAGAEDIAVCKITRCVKNSGVRPRYIPSAIADNQETGAAGESLVQQVQEPFCKKQKSCGGDFTEVTVIPEVDDSWLLSALEHDGNIEIYNSGNDGGSFTAAAEIEHAGNFELPYGGNLEAAAASSEAARPEWFMGSNGGIFRGSAEWFMGGDGGIFRGGAEWLLGGDGDIFRDSTEWLMGGDGFAV